MDSYCMKQMTSSFHTSLEKVNYSKEGNLGKFVDLVKAGEFPNGVHLVVESLDRLYRDLPHKAQAHFMNMLEEGVTVHTLMDGQVYKPEDLRDSSKVMQAIIISAVRLCASHEYSLRLSQRVRTTHKRNMERERITGEFHNSGKIPSFLKWEKTVTKGGTPSWEVWLEEEDKETIQRIFQLCIDGFGAELIARIAIQENLKPII